MLILFIDYIIDNSQVMVLWIGRQVAADLLKQYFGVESIEAIDSSMVILSFIFYYHYFT
jgi:hypothetical protein